jgi:cyclopropane fatty-acyl-phospholipid synthase-like methyltransferase
MKKTREPGYQEALDLMQTEGLIPMGITTSWMWKYDPKRLSFVFSRYKFVAKMLAGKKRVLEIGCADAFASQIVRHEVETMTAVDFDPIFIEQAKEQINPDFPIELIHHNMLEGPVPTDTLFDATYCCDVFEHIDPAHERDFLKNTLAVLKSEGVLIMGIPSLQSQAYASEHNKKQHVNCKDGGDFKALMEEYFHNVFLFSMNDEVIHTGFSSMAHYLFVICCGKK